MTNTPKLDAARAVAMLTLAAAAFWALLAISTTHHLVNAPRESSPFTTFDYGQTLLFAGGVQVQPALATLLLNLVACLVGWRLVVSPIWGRLGLASPPCLFLAGVVPGSMVFLTLSRLVTLFVSNSWAPLLIGLVIAALAVAAGVEMRSRARPHPRATALLRWGFFGTAALAAALVHQVHIDRAHVIAEGSVWFINGLFLSSEYGVANGGWWPLIGQHYDEAAFLYPIVYGLLAPNADGNSTLTVIYWITLAFSRTGLVCLTYIGLRGLAVDRLSALVVTTFCCLASLSLNLFSSRLLFDSLSPLLYVLHAARFLIPILPLLIVSAARCAGDMVPPRAYVLLVLLGMALAAMPIHAAFLFPWVLALAAASAINPEAAASRQFWFAAGIVALVVIASFTFAYGLQSVPIMLRVMALIGASSLAIVFVAVTAWRERGVACRNGGLRFGFVFAAVGGYGFALVGLGNVLIQKTVPGIWPWTEHGILDRLTLAAVRGREVAIGQSPWCESGYQWGYRILMDHCGSLAMFTRTYGLAFVVIAVVVAGRLLRPVRKDVDHRQDTILGWAITLCLPGLAFGFVLFDFVIGDSHNSLSIWLRSRLVEPWFIGGILLALALFFRDASLRARALAQGAMLVAVAVFAFNPLILPGQMAANVVYLMRIIADGR